MRARESLSADSEEEIGQLIERINHFSAHEHERCDHQIKAKMHCQGDAQKFFLQPSRNDAGTGTELMSYWRGRFAEVPVLICVGVCVNNLCQILFSTRFTR